MHHAIYVLAPDVDVDQNFARNTAPGDDLVHWLVTRPPVDNFESLVRTLGLLAANQPVNVLRFFAHGDSGVVSIFGTEARSKLAVHDPKNPENDEKAMEAVRKLRGIFDRRPARRREIWLHSCYAASDQREDCRPFREVTPQGVREGRTCQVLGHMAPAATRYTDFSRTPGFWLFQGLADLADVPVAGTPDLIPYLSRKGYDWTFPGRVIYVYPKGGLVTLPAVRIFGDVGGRLPDDAPKKLRALNEKPAKPQAAQPPSYVFPVNVSTRILHPLLERQLVNNETRFWTAQVGGALTVFGKPDGQWNVSGTLTFTGADGGVTINLMGLGPDQSKDRSPPMPINYKVVRGTGVFAGGHGAGAGSFTASIEKNRSTPLFALEFRGEGKG